MAQFDLDKHALVGSGGLLKVPAEDEITRKLLMLIEGECEGLGPVQAAQKFGYSKQRYFQLRAAFDERGATALCSQKRGPKTNYRRTPEVVRQVIRHRFLDPDASPEVIAQKLVQSGWTISIRSVERVLADYGVQKKLHRCRPRLESEHVEARLALQLVHEASLCTNGLRVGRCLTLRGFETLNGLPFLAEDTAVHELLGGRTVAEAQELQVALGKLRRASGHYAGKLLLIDPHRPPSYSHRPMRNRQSDQKRRRQIPPERFTRHWAGYATAVLPFTPHHSRGGPYDELVQRHGERPDQWHFNGFLSTTDRDPVDALTSDYPKRWHIEEFFNFNQSLGWKRAGTMNINIRYGQMTMALLAQTVIHQFRNRLGTPFAAWDARHLASEIFRGLDGDIRVVDDTIVVTYYHAPNEELLRAQYEDLPAKLRAEGVDPGIPWLYGFQLDFRFR